MGDARHTGIVCRDSPARAHAAANRSIVLLIDDAVDELDLYEMLLEDAYAVLRATRGVTGYDVACIEQPDIIVLDLMMPDLDGWTVCRMLKTNQATRRIPVVILTALDSDAAFDRARRAGAVAVMRKPCDIDALVMTIDAALAASR